MTESLKRSGASPKTGEVRPMNGRAMNERPVNENASRRTSSERRGRRSGGSAILRSILVGLIVAGLVGAPSVGFAEGKAAEVGKESGLGVAAAISSLVYGPVKLVYATGGLVVGGFAWVFTAGDTEVASQVFSRSLRGTYVITPQILTGEEKLEFIGRDVEPDETMARPEAIASTSPTTSTSSDAGETGYDEYDEMGW